MADKPDHNFTFSAEDVHYEGKTEVLPHMFARGVRVQLWHLAAAHVCVEVDPRPRIINEIITNFLTMAIIRPLAKEKK